MVLEDEAFKMKRAYALRRESRPFWMKTVLSVMIIARSEMLRWDNINCHLKDMSLLLIKSMLDVLSITRKGKSNSSVSEPFQHARIEVY